MRPSVEIKCTYLAESNIKLVYKVAVRTLTEKKVKILLLRCFVHGAAFYVDKTHLNPEI